MPHEPPVKRATACIDARNLFHTAKEAFGYGHLNLDPLKLANCTRARSPRPALHGRSRPPPLRSIQPGPNERRVAEDRPGCFWLYVVTDCDNAPRLQEPIRDPAGLDWHEVTKVAHDYLAVNAITKPMQVREDAPPYGGNRP